MKPRRVPFTVSATMFLLMIAFNSTPSDTAIHDPYRLSAISQEDQKLRDLAQWVVQSRSGRPRVFTPNDIDAILTRRPQRLGLLSPEVSDAARREQLAGLPYGPEIWRIARRHGVDGLLVASIVEVESRFRHTAMSPRGAMGLMQVLPATGQHYGVADLEQLNDPYVNLNVGCRYLGRLIKDFDGDLERAVAAYNAGPATVARYNGVPPFRETREYVRRVLELYRERSNAAWERAGAGRDPFAPLEADS